MNMKELALEYGLSEKEWECILDLMDREPNQVELGVFSAMWSEHCSYKSSKPFLKLFPTEAPWVLIGPGENAGAISVGQNKALIFKMESHNHPSYIEPFQGAATGVGGIMRDVFTMGARPIANLDCLRFGPLDQGKNAHLIEKVVEGIASYGNCMGVPTVGGDVRFDECYNGNCLVNAFCLGVADADKIFLGKAEGPGNKVMYVGAKTGRDGIHGATMASESFAEGSEEKRPTVQVGDPFMEKLLLEACLELMKEDAIIGIQDMGAAGLTSSSVEMAGRAGNGINLYLDKVPTREPEMTPYEMMLSESQERMVIILKPDKVDIAERVFKKWDLEISEIGEVTESGLIKLFFHGEQVGELNVDHLLEGMPDQHQTTLDFKPYEPTAELSLPEDAQFYLELLAKSEDFSDKNQLYQQYDSMILRGTAVGPGNGPAVVKVPGTEPALYTALTAGCNQFQCGLHAKSGARNLIYKFATDLLALRAKPLAITDCLNFGNPQKPEILSQFRDACQGMADACRELDTPVISGNVSLYNENMDEGIDPTPMVAMAGLISVNPPRKNPGLKAGDRVYLWKNPSGHLGGSLIHKILDKDCRPSIPKPDFESYCAFRDFMLHSELAEDIKLARGIGQGGALGLAYKVLSKYNLGLEMAGVLFLEELFCEDPDNAMIIVSEDSFNLIQLLNERAFSLGRVSSFAGFNGKAWPERMSLKF